MLRPSKSVGGVLGVTMAVVSALAALVVASDVGYEPGQIIVKFSPAVGKITVQKRYGVISLGIASLDQRMEQYGVHGIDQIFPQKNSELSLIYQYYFDPQYDAKAVARDFAEDEHLLYAEPRYRHQPLDTPNDSFYVIGVQWYLNAVYGPQAWDVTHGDSSVVIGIVDTGVDWNHPDLEGNRWLNSGEDLNGNGQIDTPEWNFVDDDSNGFVDDFWGWDFGGAGYPDNVPDERPGPLGSHGTHCAGIASAVTNNDLACAGMSWNCLIMAVKASLDGGSNIIYGYEGIQYAADNGADVIHLGWGSTSSSQFEQEVVDSAFAKGAILVAAAGNDPPSAPPDTCPWIYPACYHHVTAVAATDMNDQAPNWTYYGSWVDVSAPGQGIYNTLWNNTYAMRQGTSRSCALVAGVAALLKVIQPGTNSDEFELRMRTASDDIDSLNPGYEGWLGGGRLNAYRALSESVPVVLASFEAIGTQSYIALNWVTSSEVNCHRWEIYRGEREDGKYIKIGELSGHGSTETAHTYRWVDRQVTAGMTCFYKLKYVDFDGSSRWSHVVSATVSSTVPKSYALHQNYPNPFNASTEIRYQIPQEGHVTLRIFNTLGQEVRTLVETNQKAGEYEVLWDGRDASNREVASGLYFCRLRVGEFAKTIKMVLVR